MCSPYQTGAIAITTVTSNSNTGEILDADMEINAVDKSFTDVIMDPEPRPGIEVHDLQNTLTHEFGHLIGLADEYNRVEEHYLNVTGEEPAVGDTAGLLADATKTAGDIKAKLPLDDKLAAPIDPSNDARWGANLAAVITAALGRKQGGFSRLVAQEYAKANGGASVYTDIQKAFNDKSVPGFQDNLSASVRPFLYSNRSLMGTMQTTPAKGAGGKDAPEHEHPIEPRHVQPFVNLLAKEWTLQTGKADVWKPERR